MWFHNRVPGPDRLSLCCTLLYDVRVRILYIPVIHFCCLCCAMCCYPAVAAAPVLLLAAAVRHRVPSNTICCCGLLHLIPVFYFSSSKHELFLMYPLTVLSACTASIYLSYKYYTSSLITGMRGAKAGVGPPRRSPPCILRYILYTQTSCR